MLWFDTLHTKHNRFMTAIDDADLKDTAYQEGVILASFMSGPWLGAGNFGKVTGCWGNYYKFASHEDKAYRLCYPDIIFFWFEGKTPANAFTEDHYLEIWFFFGASGHVQQNLS